MSKHRYFFARSAGYFSTQTEYGQNFFIFCLLCSFDSPSIPLSSTMVPPLLAPRCSPPSQRFLPSASSSPLFARILLPATSWRRRPQAFRPMPRPCRACGRRHVVVIGDDDAPCPFALPQPPRGGGAVRRLRLPSRLGRLAVAGSPSPPLLDRPGRRCLPIGRFARLQC